MVLMAFSVAAILAVAMLTGPWPPLFVVAALAWLALVVAICVAGLVWQGLEYGREQRIERATRLAELERWLDQVNESEGTSS